MKDTPYTVLNDDLHEKANRVSQEDTERIERRKQKKAIKKARRLMEVSLYPQVQ